ncbi:MAG: hypothetical protein JWQ01_4805 [Massilia sp.]|nr:hypothetical protein [Massilia sp.]
MSADAIQAFGEYIVARSAFSASWHGSSIPQGGMNEHLRQTPLYRAGRMGCVRIDPCDRVGGVMSRNQREGKFDGKVWGRFCRRSPQQIQSLIELDKFFVDLNARHAPGDRREPDERTDKMFAAIHRNREQFSAEAVGAVFAGVGRRVVDESHEGGN